MVFGFGITKALIFFLQNINFTYIDFSIFRTPKSGPISPSAKHKQNGDLPDDVAKAISSVVDGIGAKKRILDGSKAGNSSDQKRPKLLTPGVKKLENSLKNGNKESSAAASQSGHRQLKQNKHTSRPDLVLKPESSVPVQNQRMYHRVTAKLRFNTIVILKSSRSYI